MSLDFVHTVHKSQDLWEPEDAVSNLQRLSIAVRTWREWSQTSTRRIDATREGIAALRWTIGDPIQTFGAIVTPPSEDRVPGVFEGSNNSAETECSNRVNSAGFLGKVGSRGFDLRPFGPEPSDIGDFSEQFGGFQKEANDGLTIRVARSTGSQVFRRR
jgi:hypothetical protein